MCQYFEFWKLVHILLSYDKHSVAEYFGLYVQLFVKHDSNMVLQQQNTSIKDKDENLSYRDVFNEWVMSRRFHLQPLFFVWFQKQVDCTMSAAAMHIRYVTN